MSPSFIDRTRNKNINQNNNSVIQKKIDPVAQARWMNSLDASTGWGISDNPQGFPVQKFSDEEKQEKENEHKNTHTVKRGDTYYSLSKKYGVTIEQLRLWNGYKDTEIPLGIELIVNPNLSNSRIISSSTRRPLLDPFDPTKLRDDLVFGDKTNEDIVEEGNDYLINLNKVDASRSDQQLFASFHQMAGDLFTSSDMTPVLRAMINLFESNSGGEMGKELSADGKGYAVFTNEKLNQEVKNSEEVQELLIDVEAEIIEHLNRQIHPDKIKLLDIDRPKFDDFWTHTFRGGLTIALNDTQAFDIVLNNLEIEDGGIYSGSFTITIYDHFGLDDGDVTPGLFPLAGFRAWYRLQRERGYRPFVTQINVSRSFSGKIGN